MTFLTISPTAFEGFRDAALERGEPFRAMRDDLLGVYSTSTAELHERIYAPYEMNWRGGSIGHGSVTGREP